MNNAEKQQIAKEMACTINAQGLLQYGKCVITFRERKGRLIISSHWPVGSAIPGRQITLCAESDISVIIKHMHKRFMIALSMDAVDFEKEQADTKRLRDAEKETIDKLVSMGFMTGRYETNVLYPPDNIGDAYVGKCMVNISRVRLTDISCTPEQAVKIISMLQEDAKNRR